MDINQDGKYYREIVRRSFSQSRDDYHATVTRLSDKTELWFISPFKWMLKLKTRRRALDRAFKGYDKYQAKLGKKDRDVI